MSKRYGKKDVVIDPVVTKVHQSMEENVTFFLQNLGPTLARFSDCLKQAMPHNPKACHYYYEFPEDEEAQKIADAEKAAQAELESPASGDELAVKRSRLEGGASPKNNSPERQDRPPTSPLLRRPRLDPAVVAEMEASARVMLSPSMQDINNHGTFPAVTPAVVEQPAEASAKDSAAITIEKKKKKKDDADKTDAEVYAEIAPPVLLIEQIRILKREARQVWRTFEGVHDWMALNIPAMKDEDNIGVGVMGAVITEIAEIISLAKSVYSVEMKFLSERSEIEQKVIKYPTAVSYRDGLDVYDANTWDDLERGWRSLMRGTLLAHSVLSKNMKILKEPRRKTNSIMAM